MGKRGHTCAYFGKNNDVLLLFVFCQIALTINNDVDF